MTLPVAPEELSKVLQSHQVCLTSGYKEGERAIEGADLQEVDLRNAATVLRVTLTSSRYQMVSLWPLAKLKSRRSVPISPVERELGVTESRRIAQE